MWRCPNCRKRTEIQSNPPCDCGVDPKKYQKIEVVHKAVQTPQGRKILCTDSPPRGAIRAVGGNYGITCIRCKQAMKEGKAQHAPVNEATNIDELPQTTQSDTIQAEPEKVDLSSDGEEKVDLREDSPDS